MSLINWLDRSLLARLRGTPRTRRAKSIACPRPYRPRLEALEGRLAPAVNISVIATGVGNLDHFLSPTQGTITTALDPGDTKATLSEAALQSVGAEVPISIAATNSITFMNLNLGLLNLQTDSGLDATFATNTGPIGFANLSNTVSTSGGSLHFNAGAGLTVGNLNTNGGDVSLTAGLAGAGNVVFTNIRTGGSGNLSFQATNAAGGTITQVFASSAASGLAISATATGNINVRALRGTAVDLTSNNGSVNSAGPQTVQASAQLSVSAATGITMNVLAATLSASNSISGNINIAQAASPRQTLAIAGSGGGVVNGAAGGQIRLTNFGSGITVENGVGVQTNNGTITLVAADFNLAGPVNSGSAATFLANSTAGRQIDIGTHVPGKLGLTQAELNNVTAGALRIGSTNSGTINVSSAITAAGTWNVLALISGGGITEAAAGSLTVPDLRVKSAGPVSLFSANNVGALAASSASSFSFSNGPNPLLVGIVDGQVGIATNQNNVHLIADDMDIAQRITTSSSSAGVVNLEPFSFTQNIHLGDNGLSRPLALAGSLVLNTTELNEITAGVLRLGSTSFTAFINVTSAINPLHIGALSLETTSTGSISQGAGDTITVASGSGALAIRSQTTTALNEQNDVATLAAAIGGSNKNFSFTNIKKLAMGTVDGVSGVTASGTVTIND
jgi:hypothetical protein